MAPTAAAAGSIFIIGSGPLFARHAFRRLALFVRTADNLARDAAFVTADAAVPTTTTVDTYTANVADAASLTTGPPPRRIPRPAHPEVVLYNAARLQARRDRHLTRPTTCWKTIKSLRGGIVYTTASVAAAAVGAAGGGEGGGGGGRASGAVCDGRGAGVSAGGAAVFRCRLAKAAQVSLVMVLARKYEGRVHGALLTVGTGVSLEEGREGHPEKIAGNFWELWGQERGRWEFGKRVGF